MTRLTAKFLAALALGLTAISAIATAHEGHDEAAPAAAAPSAPRLVAEGSEWEIVATPEGHLLTIFLDHHETNEPIKGAKIEVTGEGLPQTKAKEIGNGTYEIDGEWLDEPGSKALTFIVTVGGEMDLIAGTLVIPGADADHGAVPSSWMTFLARPELWLMGVVLALGVFPGPCIPSEAPAA